MVMYFIISSCLAILVKGVISSFTEAWTTCFRTVGLFNISEDCTDCMEYKLCPAALNLVLNKTVKAEKTFREAVCDYGLNNGTKSLKVCCSMLQEHAADVQKFNVLPDQCGEIREDRLFRGPVVNLFDYEWLAVFNKSSGDALCLPKSPAPHDSDWFNNLALTVGWGAPNTVPLKSYLRGFNDTTCNDFYKRYPDLKNNTFCARDLYDNTNLDPGSPLLTRSTYGKIPIHVQYGILSQEVGKQHYIYTNVNKYMAWILKALRDLD
ncbi:unnamed protein product [Pieris macdunnoughi]|uniref:Peptidase S1 domain-containing protein n=1 Tax=Pieris macdunnoughi TaxID=345717 RepID=A0A821NQS6_9NEOP|nr:unnamed protein product [Pieris macdunnoughi]